MKKLFLRLDFFRSVLTLITGKVVAQAIPIAISPILTRIYSPENFGVFGLYMAVTALIALGATGTYEHAIVLSEKDEEAANVIALAGLIALVVSVTILFVIILFNPLLAYLLDNNEISVWLYLVPVNVLSISFFQIFTLWMVRRKRYGFIANSSIVRTVINATFNLSMGVAGLGVSGLIVGQLVGQTVAASILGILTWREIKGTKNYITRRQIIKLAKRYSDFPRYNLFHSFLDGFRDNGIIFLINHFFVVSILGFYSLSLRVLRTPLNIIGSSIAQVFYQEIAQAHNAEQDLWRHLRENLLRLTLLSLPVFIGLVALGPEIFTFVFGDQWTEAGRYAQILAPWIALNFISSPVSVVPLVLMKQRAFLFIGIGYNVLIFSAFGLGAAIIGDIETTLAYVSVIASVYLLGVIFWTVKLTTQNKQTVPVLEQP